MIDLIPDLPPNVVGLIASGQVSSSDYESVAIPAIEAALRRREQVRVLYQIGSAFTGFTAGAMWDDAKLGFAHLKAWDKVAIVSDVDWLNRAVGLLKFAIPCPVKVFSNREYTEAAAWIAA